MISRFLSGVAICLASSLFFVSCSKEDTKTGHVLKNEFPQKLTGAVPDDPAVMNSVPMIVSSSFLKHNPSGFGSTQMGRGKPDNVLPNVAITSPGSASVISGAALVLVSASDNVGVTSVNLKVDGILVATDNSSPYSFSWNSGSVVNGPHTLTATAFDAAGNMRSVTIQVTTNNAIPGDQINPNVSITSPFNLANVSNSINIQASANDNVGVSSVNFLINGVLIGSDNTAPYSISWNSNTVPPGLHNLAATALDAAGNSATNTIQITVNTTVITPPISLPSNYQLTMPQVGYQGAEGSCVAWAVAYARSTEQFYRTNASNYNFASNIFSPEFLFNNTRIDDYCSGSALIGALLFLQNNGVCTWQSMPYSDVNGCAVMPTPSQNAEAINYRIASYAGIYNSDISAIKTKLVNKHPLVAYVSIDQNFRNATPGYIWNSLSTTFTELHAVVICGYDDTRHAYKIMNSWGTAWGDAGYLWVDYDFFPSVSSSLYVMNF